ncbi:hypothetical protein ACTPD5_22560, partial [Clostridioides difficile]
VASSKLRKAKEKAEDSREYFNTLYNTVKDIAQTTRGIRNEFLDNNLSPKGQESNQNNIMNVKNTIGFTSEADNYEKKIPINNN